MKILLVTSAGGHLDQLLRLRTWWERHDRAWVTEDSVDSRSRLRNERVHHAHFPTNRNIPNLFRNLRLALFVLTEERPDVVLSTGAGVAVPFFWLAASVGAKTVYVEVFDRIEKPTLTGRFVYPFVDLFLVQWPEQLDLYPGAKLLQPLL